MTTKTKEVATIAHSTNLDELLTSNVPIYVKNNTSPRGILVIDFSNPVTGQNLSYQVQKTWIPLEISAAIPKQTLGNSVDFRAYVVKGILQIIPQANAEKTLATKEAKEELKRINSSRFSEMGKGNKKNDIITRDVTLKGKDGQINPQVRNILIALETGLAEEGASKQSKKDLKNKTLSDLRTVSDELGANDWGFVLKEARSKKIRNFAKARLSELDAGGDNDNNDDDD